MAGFFGFFDYTKPGKGVSKDEPERSPFVRFFILLKRKFGRLCQLNMLFVLFCIPIITIGPAIAGMTYVLRNFVNERPVFLISDFWDAFKSNFKQSFIYGIICAVISYALWISWQFYFNGTAENAFMYVPAACIFLITVVFVFANFYIYLMIVTLDLPLKAIIKNGFLLTVLGIKNNFITAFFVGLTMFAFWCVYITGYILYLVFGFALIGFIIVFNAYPVVKKYAIDPFVKQTEEVTAEQGENIFSDEFPKEETES